MAIADNIAMLDEACAAGGAATMKKAAEAPLDQKATLLWTECELEGHGLVEASVAKAADSTALILAHMAFAPIEARGGVAAKERELLEIAATIPPP